MKPFGAQNFLELNRFSDYPCGGRKGCILGLFFLIPSLIVLIKGN
jgi:hypothetical protein